MIFKQGNDSLSLFGKDNWTASCPLEDSVEARRQFRQLFKWLKWKMVKGGTESERKLNLKSHVWHRL